MKTVEYAPAKLNLSLDVLGKRPDRYHEMKMVMQAISLYDEVELTATEGRGRMELRTNRSFLPTNEKNLAYAAAQHFLEAAGLQGWDLRIALAKRIPVCAGMAGGSADAAAVLRGLDRLFPGKVTREALFACADRVGSDVGFCLLGGTALATGRGTELTKLAPMPPCGIAVVKPAFSVSTPWLFNRLDSIRLRSRPDTEGLMEALDEGDLLGLARRCYNIFEAVLPARERSIVDEAKGELISRGALAACMTGTGSAVFGIYETEAQAKKAVDSLRAQYEECWACTPIA